MDYKDDPADDSPYQSRIDVPFTTDTAAFTAGVRSLDASGGGDTPESVYSGVMTGLNLPWRPGVRKSVIVIGDAPGKDPEPVTGYTLSDVVKKAFSVDPAEVYSVPVAGDPDASAFMKTISDGTGGTVIDGSDTSTIVDNLEKAITEAGTAPMAELSVDDSALVGEKVEFSGKGTRFDPTDPVASYDWNFGAGTPVGSYDTTTTTPFIDHSYTAPGTYTTSLRTRTRSGLAGLATATITVAPAPTAKPAQPEGLTATADGTTGILHWSAGPGPQPDYYAIRDSTGDVVDAFTPQPNAVQEWQALDLTSAQAYQVYAVNAAGLSDPAGPVTVTPADADHPPTSAPDDFTGTMGTPMVVPAPGVLTGDHDADAGDTITAQLVSNPAHGTVSLAADGSFTYIPASGFIGDDVFTYQAVDTAGARSPVTAATLHISAPSLKQRFRLRITGKGAPREDGYAKSGGFVWTVTDHRTTALSGKAVIDDSGATSTVTISTSQTSSGVSATVAVDSPGGHQSYSGIGDLETAGKHSVRGSFTYVGADGRPVKFDIVIRTLD